MVWSSTTCALGLLICLCQREDVYKNFRWTPRTTLIGIYGILIVPGLIYYTASSGYVRTSVFLLCLYINNAVLSRTVEVGLGRKA